LPAAADTLSRAGTHSVLDHFGRSALAFVDYRVVGLTILLVIAVFTIYTRWKKKRYPPIDDYFRVGEACGLLATGLIAGCVFLLTSPPAVEELSHESRLVIGLVTVLLTFHVGIKTIRDTCNMP
jgi:uncharacterized BrkB/YihY/UPF0761 family membrane protein